MYPVMAEPPLNGADQLTASWFTTVEDTVGVDGKSGTVVTETDSVVAPELDPEAFAATIVNVYEVLEANP